MLLASKEMLVGFQKELKENMNKITELESTDANPMIILRYKEHGDYLDKQIKRLENLIQQIESH
jgi:hypothetical protein